MPAQVAAVFVTLPQPEAVSMVMETVTNRAQQGIQLFATTIVAQVPTPIGVMLKNNLSCLQPRGSFNNFKILFP